jgi:hypothetical protein
VTAAGCDNSSSTPTSPSTGTTSVTQVMSGDMAPGDTPLHTFTIPGTAPLHIMLGSLVGTNGLPLGSTIALLYGVPNADNTVCNPLTRVSTPVALKAQINVTASAGLYCVALADTASVPGAAHYAIRIIYGTPSDTDAAGTIDYVSTVIPGGTTSRTFGASTEGTATITMNDFQPPGVATLGLAVGFQRNDNTGCEVSAATFAARGAVFNVPVDPGRYCVKIFDPGTLTGLTTFSIKIAYP